MKDLFKKDLTEEEILLLTATEMFVSYQDLMSFPSSFPGIISCLQWEKEMLANENDAFRVIADIYEKTGKHQEFRRIYEEFYTLMNGRDMDKKVYIAYCNHIIEKINGRIKEGSSE